MRHALMMSGCALFLMSAGCGRDGGASLASGAIAENVPASTPSAPGDLCLSGNSSAMGPTGDAAGFPASCIRRCRRARIDATAFSDNARLTLNLFDDVRLSAILEASQSASSISSNVLWRGRIDGASSGRATFVVTPDGRVTGCVEAPGTRFEIRPDADGDHLIIEVDMAALPPPECCAKGYFTPVEETLR